MKPNYYYLNPVQLTHPPLQTCLVCSRSRHGLCHSKYLGLDRLRGSIHNTDMNINIFTFHLRLAMNALNCSMLMTDVFLTTSCFFSFGCR